jgi:dihydroorotate dehydrogenase electron transfer subunit
MSVKQLKAPVFSNDEVMPNVYLAWLKAPEIATMVKPGQFIMLRCGEDNLLRRPLSVHRLDESRQKLAILYTVVGRGTRWLSQLKEGDTVDILGALGNGFKPKSDANKLLLVAGGLGIAPLCFLARQMTREGYKVRLVVGAATMQHLPIHLLPSGGACSLATEDGSAGFKGLVTECLSQFTEEADQIFACGPLPMYRSLARMSQLEGKLVQVSLEVRMACGLNLCYGCTIRTKSGLKQVCHDGPVFDLDEIIWEEIADI